MGVTDSDGGRIVRMTRPREADVGSLLVRRSLPVTGLRHVGPWVFFDHFGPAEFAPGKGVDVIPHPHINLATVTYLLEGEMVHRDTIGSIQPITPGAINLMVAGRGIAHSERTGAEKRAAGGRLHGVQLWQALPEADEEIEPWFKHYQASSLPRIAHPGVSVRVLIGSLEGRESPVRRFSDTLFAEIGIDADASFDLNASAEELALYVVGGGVTITGTTVPQHRMTSVVTGAPLRLEATGDSLVIVLGGACLGNRHMWWNFVSSRKERIEQAKSDWKRGIIPDVPGDDERHPLPEHDSVPE